MSAAAAPGELRLSIGQFSDRGRKETNQDFHGAMTPVQPALGLKGVAIAIADGISSSDAGAEASEAAVKGFLTDYFCTSDSWSVKTSATRVIAALNSWLHAQSRRSRHAHDIEHGMDKGHVCTLSVLVVKSAVAHVFHVGDSRVSRVSGNCLERLTEDHRVTVSAQQSYLGRALGVNPHVEIDYRAVALEVGDTFVLSTDGVHEHAGARFVAAAVRDNAGDLDAAAKAIVAEAFRNGSADNLTVQVVRVDALPRAEGGEALAQGAALALPPLLEARGKFEGYTVVRQIHASSRSHIYLCLDDADGTQAAVKIPSIDQRGDPAYLRRFMMEEWAARRIDSPHVLRALPHPRKRGHLFAAMEFIEGQTLTQWMRDNPRPHIEAVRAIVEQIAAGLRAFHRKEMLHQDLRPENILVDRTGTVKIIDFGAVRVAGVSEAAPSADDGAMLGTHQYSAPEYFLGQGGTPRSDLFSLGVIAYQMLTGLLPYGASLAKARTGAQMRKLAYASALNANPAVPAWVDRVLKRAVHPDPASRHGDVDEFTYALRHPDPSSMPAFTPLAERNPLLFWKVMCLILVGLSLFLLIPLRR